MPQAGQRVVDRPVVADQAGGEGEADGRVDRVVDRGAAVRAVEDLQVDQVRAFPREPFIVQPVPARGIGDDDAGLGDEVLDQPLRVGIAEVRGERALALVQARPVDRLAAVCQRPASVVRGAADGVDPDDLRPSWASVMPQSGAATKLETSTTRTPARGAEFTAPPA